MTEVISKKEKLLLEYTIADKEVFVKVYHILKPEYFESPLDKVVGFIMDYFAKHSDVPNVDVIEAETEIELKERELDRDEQSYLLEELETHCKNAAMSLAILESVDLINEDRTEAVHELIRQAMLVRLDNNIGMNLIESYPDRVAEHETLGEDYSSGILPFDEMIGNLRRAEFGMVYAITSGGKSIMLANMAVSLALQKLNVVIITLELKEHLYCKRLDAIATNSDIRKHSENSEFIGQYYADHLDDFGNISVKKMRAGSTASEIEAFITEYTMMMEQTPDVIIVDYLQLMGNPNIKSTNKFDLDHEKAMGLIRIAEEFDAIMISAGQINREGYDVVKPSPAHCAGGISVINDSDWSVALVGTEEDIENNQIQVAPLKIRHTKRQTKNLMLYRNPESLKMTDQPIDAASGLPKNGNPVKNKFSGKSNEKRLRKALNIGNR